MRKYCILFYNSMWGKYPDFSDPRIPDNFIFTTDRSYLDMADAVVFHMPTIARETRIQKKDGQLWVFWSEECEANYPVLYSNEILQLFDLHMTYRLNAEITVTYFHYSFNDELRRQPVAKTEFAAAFISSNVNKSKRVEYLQKLMSLLDVHSYGTLFNNKTMDNDTGRPAKSKIISTYKFTIAFENAIGQDYVTEKFFDPLIAGSVPIYLGAPNIDEFAPGEHCYINVNSFKSPEELAEYLLLLDKNDHLYEEYLKWKKAPFRPEFMDKLNLVKPSELERLCYKVQEKKENKQRGC